MTDDTSPRHLQQNPYPRAFWELHDKKGTAGLAEYAEWHNAAMVHWALLINEAELMRLIDFSDEAGQRHAIALISELSGGAVENLDFWGFLFARLTNYVAMNNALIDHVRNLLHDYEGTAFRAEADTRRQALGKAPAMSFIKEFRNYLLHYRVAPMTVNLNMSDGVGVDFEARLNAPVLSNWDGWCAESKLYFTGRKDLSILATLRECHSLREEFYDWLWEQFAGPATIDTWKS